MKIVLLRTPAFLSPLVKKIFKISETTKYKSNKLDRFTKKKSK